MSDEPIRLVDYDPRWPQLFQQERLPIAVALGTMVASIEHIGSTAVPAVARTKPIIDLAVGLRSWADRGRAVQALEKLGFVVGDPFSEEHVCLRAGTPRRAHVHLAVFDADVWRRHVVFRDWLNLFEDDARAYAALKLRLAEQHARDRRAYADAKTEFVESILAKAQRFPARRLALP